MAKATAKTIGILEISPARFQPRTNFEQAKIIELAESIREHGILQPLIVQKKAGCGYEIIAGERRFRASKLLGLTEIPCRIMKLSEAQGLAVALVENIQREDLNPIEEARAYRRIQQVLGLSQEEIGKRVGKQRASIANTMRLLRLPELVQRKVVSEELTMGHARALLALDDQEILFMLAKKIAREGLSVRKTEMLVRGIRLGGRASWAQGGKQGAKATALEKELAKQISYVLGARASIKRDNHGYLLNLNFFDEDQLNNFLTRLEIEI